MRSEIRFMRRGREVRLGDVSPTLTLLDYLRLTERATGTKEGCAEGDCGACTVVLRKLAGAKLVYQAVNACICLAGQADGADVITVEDLASDGLHPVQRAMVDLHGSQCGFCTPGFVMALFALYHAPRDAPHDRESVNAWLAGNLCRCTGYRPIVDAALSSCRAGAADRFSADDNAVGRTLSAWASPEDVFVGDGTRFFAAPGTVGALARVYEEHPDAVLIGGATDVGLWITKQLRVLPKIIWLGRVRGLDTIEDKADAVTFGAAVPHQQALPYLANIDPDLGELVRRFAGLQVRTVGTIGGNIANGSPIGDMPPALIALDAALALQRGEKTRSLPLEEFFIAYGKQDRAPGEFIRAVRVPKLKPGEHFRCYKISKRFDQDISAIMGAFKLSVDGTRVTAARVAFGGMAATPKRGRETESALVGVDLADPATWNAAIAALGRDFAPIGDLRASADYRNTVARSLLFKALVEIGGAPTHETRLVGVREAVHGQP